MRYWLYSEGNIIGPYTPADLLGLPAFGQGSLVCPERSTGEAAEDWKPAEQVAEISAAMSVGVGGVIEGGGMAGFYSMESGYPSGAGQYYDYKFQDGTSYSSALEAIESVLGASAGDTMRHGVPVPSADVPSADEDRALLDKFDVRLSRIQEELEAARWEKNLLLEKMRLKEAEERKTRERMTELEARLKDALDGRFPPAPETLVRGAQDDRETPAVETSRSAAPQAPAKESAEAPGAEAHSRHEEILEESRKVEEFSKKEIAPEAAPSTPLKHFKSIKPSQTLKREKLLDEDDGEGEPPAGKRSLKSLGYAKPKRILGDEQEEVTASAPIPGSALVYDFTVVTPQGSAMPHGVPERVNFKLQPLDAPQGDTMRHGVPVPFDTMRPVAELGTAALPPQVPEAMPTAPAPTAGNAALFRHGVPVQSVPTAAPIVFSPGSPAEELKPAHAGAVPAAAAPAEGSPEKTLRLPTADIKAAGDTMPHGVPAAPRKGRGRAAFLVVMVIFAAIAAGGISFFFLGDGISLSDFSMIGSPAKKAPGEEEAPPAGGGAVGGQPGNAQPPETETGDARPAAGETVTAPQQAAPAPPHQPASNESARKAVETVKNHRLPGGRGAISAWFSNSFLSTSAGGMNEEWSATVLHGDIFVVQYRLLRPRQDPLVYQFEVDVARGMIVRGINNSAIELMDFPSGDKVSAAAKPASAGDTMRHGVPVPRAAPRAAGAGGQIPILPLPDDDAPAVSGDAAPTGFENVDVNDEKVRYIVAQESDEELF